METCSFFVVGSDATPLEFYLPNRECYLRAYKRYLRPFTHSAHLFKFESYLCLTLGHHEGDGYYDG
jgi:hypothetical protein